MWVDMNLSLDIDKVLVNGCQNTFSRMLTLCLFCAFFKFCTLIFCSNTI